MRQFFFPLNKVSFKTFEKTFADAHFGEVFITANVKGSQNVLNIFEFPTKSLTVVFFLRIKILKKINN